MKLVSTNDLERPEGQGILARPLLEGEQSNVRIIRIAAGQALPPHKHGMSDLMLYAAGRARSQTRSVEPNNSVRSSRAFG
jgi:hypothetical protein